MLKRIAITLLLVLFSAPAARAQQGPSPDSLVDYWLRRGARASWQPHHLYTGCPALAAWQRQGIERLLAADLSRERTNDLARAWSSPLATCNNARLEQWYFDHVNAAMGRRERPEALLTFWTALGQANTPRVRDYLRRLMLDTGKPEAYRTSAGASLFAPLGRAERLREYLSAFETRRLPLEVAVGQTTLILRHDAEALLSAVGQRVRANPALADQPAFGQIAESSDRYATPGARRALGEALQAGVRGSALTERQRTRLEATAQWLARARER